MHSISSISKTKPNGLAGYTKDDRDGVRLYHFFPGTFRKEFEDQYGKEVYSLLRDAGFLLAQKGRHNLTSVRLPGGGQRNGQRQDFVVISGAILDSLDEG